MHFRGFIRRDWRYGGFRGACLALVEPDAFGSIGERVREVYLRAFPQYAPTFGFFRCASGPSAHLLT